MCYGLFCVYFQYNPTFASNTGKLDRAGARLRRRSCGSGVQSQRAAFVAWQAVSGRLQAGLTASLTTAQAGRIVVRSTPFPRSKPPETADVSLACHRLILSMENVDLAIPTRATDCVSPEARVVFTLMTYHKMWNYQCPVAVVILTVNSQ